MPLTKAFKALAMKLQEQAADALSHNDLCKWLSDACNDIGSDEGGYCWMVDICGDGESGDVVYCCNGDMMRAPYTISSVNGKMTASIDHEAAEDVLPRTIYEPEADEADHYASTEALREKFYSECPLYERFISKTARDNAPSGSFAGKGKSFPILKPGDVSAAASSLGRAGSDNYDTGTIKRNIIRIAKAKGWSGSLPKAWQDGKDDSKESAVEIDIADEFVALKEGAVGQDGSAYLKLIAPGRGSSGYYPAEVLERDGPKVFPAGTKNFWNHQTDAEEAARPEGDLRDLASVLSEDAHYEAKGPAGPGLYARAKVFEQFRQPVDDLAKHIGMSIRATGKAKEGKAPDGKTGPIIEQLTRGLSVDYVTTPGAGGKVLQLFEAARAAKPAQAEIPLQEATADMTDAEVKEIKESNAKMALELRKLKERAAIADAGGVIAAYFTTIRVGEAIQKRVSSRILATAVPLTESGDLDKAKLTALVEAETKDECTYLSEVAGRQVVSGMGSAPAQPTAAEIAATEAEVKTELDANAGNYGVSTKEGKNILTMGRSAFSPDFNARLKETA